MDDESMLGCKVTRFEMPWPSISRSTLCSNSKCLLQEHESQARVANILVLGVSDLCNVLQALD